MTPSSSSSSKKALNSPPFFSKKPHVASAGGGGTAGKGGAVLLLSSSSKKKQAAVQSSIMGTPLSATSKSKQHYSTTGGSNTFDSLAAARAGLDLIKKARLEEENSFGMSSADFHEAFQPSGSGSSPPVSQGKQLFNAIENKYSADVSHTTTTTTGCIGRGGDSNIAPSPSFTPSPHKERKMSAGKGNKGIGSVGSSLDRKPRTSTPNQRSRSRLSTSPTDRTSARSQRKSSSKRSSAKSSEQPKAAKRPREHGNADSGLAEHPKQKKLKDPNKAVPVEVVSASQGTGTPKAASTSKEGKESPTIPRKNTTPCPSPASSLLVNMPPPKSPQATPTYSTKNGFSYVNNRGYVKLCISNLPFHAFAAKILEFLKPFGKVFDITLDFNYNRHNPKLRCFLTMHNEDAKAVRDAAAQDELTMDGNRLKVSEAPPREKQVPDEVELSMDERDLEKIYKKKQREFKAKFEYYGGYDGWLTDQWGPKKDILDRKRPYHQIAEICKAFLLARNGGNKFSGERGSVGFDLLVLLRESIETRQKLYHTIQFKTRRRNRFAKTTNTRKMSANTRHTRSRPIARRTEISSNLERLFGACSVPSNLIEFGKLRNENETYSYLGIFTRTVREDGTTNVQIIT